MKSVRIREIHQPRIVTCALWAEGRRRSVQRRRVVRGRAPA
jgi:hypothetical protein